MKAIFILFTLLLVSSNACAELSVIVHPSNTSNLDINQVKRIFLGKQAKFDNGSKAVPVNQDASSDSRQNFDKSLLGRSSSQVSAYWSKLVFTGKGIPPKEVKSDAEAIELVSKNVDMIAYIDSSNAAPSVKVVTLN